MTDPFSEANAASRHRLESLLSRLSDEDLARMAPSGWTVSALLAHLAYWDQRIVVLLRRWKANGVDESPVDSDAVNDALKPLCTAMPARTAVELCLASARAADAELESTTTELLEQIQSSPNHFRFNRALHRGDHLHEIELLLNL